jgi:hypothetical protein
MKRVTMALALAGGLAAAVPASAGYTVQGIPGTSCSVDRRSNAPWEYQGRRLINRGTYGLDLVIAVCPVTLFVPGQQPREYRVVTADSLHQEIWCQVYAADGTRVRTQYGDGGYTISGTLDYPLGWSSVGLVEATFHCLVRAGGSLERIEIVWWKP